MYATDKKNTYIATHALHTEPVTNTSVIHTHTHAHAPVSPTPRKQI